MNNAYLFCIISIVFQLIGGLGSGCNAVASMSMVIAGAEKNERVSHIGLIETTTGVGFLLGPVWGSLMYQLGGYPAPFACSGKFDTILINYDLCL